MEMFTSLYRMIDKHEVTEVSDSNSMNGDMKIIVDCIGKRDILLFPIQPKLTKFPSI